MCHRRKKDSAFNKKGKRLQAFCRMCQHERFKGYYEADRDGHYQKVRENKLQRIAKIREVTDEYKKGSCADCGRSFPPVAMDFDHVRGEKKFEIATAIAGGAPLERILEEIKKCEVVCAVCHRLRTEKRRVCSSTR